MICVKIEFNIVCYRSLLSHFYVMSLCLVSICNLLMKSELTFTVVSTSGLLQVLRRANFRVQIKALTYPSIQLSLLIYCKKLSSCIEYFSDLLYKRGAQVCHLNLVSSRRVRSCLAPYSVCCSNVSSHMWTTACNWQVHFI